MSMEDIRRNIHSPPLSSRPPHRSGNRNLPHSSTHPTHTSVEPQAFHAPIGGIRLELPIFSSTDPYGWIFQIQEYFDFYGVVDANRLRMAAFAMEGDASEWYRWIKNNNLLSTWPDFMEKVKLRFGPSQFIDHRGQLSKLTQIGTMVEYQSQFEKLLNKVTGISEEMLISMFIAGLKPYLEQELLLAKPATLEEAFALAKMFAGKHELLQQPNRPRQQWISTPTPLASRQQQVLTNLVSSSGHMLTQPRPLSTASQNPPLPNIPIRHLSAAEMRDKRNRGLCYKCNQKWSVNHHCNCKFLMLLGVNDDESEGVLEPIRPEDEITISPDISTLNTLVSVPNPRSLRIEGVINSQPVHILIDGGSTHNFVQPAIAKKLNLFTTSIDPFRVYIGNGDYLRCQFRCPEVPLVLQEANFTIDLFVLPIQGPDIVLGVQWLQQLGKITHDYAQLSMEFNWQGRLISLQGDQHMHLQHVSFNQLQALFHGGRIEDIYELFYFSTEEENQNIQVHSHSELLDIPPGIPTEATDLIHAFEHIFRTPHTLPPHRMLNHKIHLLPGSKPMNVRPYRYPYFQKSEMEKLVKEMLEQGTIRPSQSPFSSLVVLVKKKDDTYRFCVDYCALMIPTIDELFDELGGSAIFSKLDLRAGYHQIRVHEKDIYKTAFRTHEGHYEFIVMLFGLTNAPSTFQATMNSILAPFLLRHCNTIRHLRMVFECLANHTFYVKLYKCKFCQLSVDYLDHIVAASGIHADPSKIEAMVSWPQPRNQKQLRGFLGLTGYYRRFVQGYAKIAAPLTNLLKNDSFNWSDAATTAFLQLKSAMSKAPVLRLPDFKKIFIVETDASDVGIGAVLLQDEQPPCLF
ncbi:PREDICTED: uncharacterized protein LOC109154292 [Ipomoea nil]|uniref:uncharacterized protein LOC109154292 n=1 Tax=Ipomoea nil TaxID=35883 RepID=UPI0009014C4E|nr:PREDICTED: uncharacterized protein LOC109154292 [Ipomoea nil]